MRVRKLWSILLIAFMLGSVMLLAEGGDSVKAAEAVEVTERKLTEDVVYNGPAVIKESIDLNGHVLCINGDLEIAGWVTLNRGTLVVDGDILHTAECVNVGQGIIDVSGDYRIQNRRVRADGTEEFLDSVGYVLMQEKDGLIRIAGDFIIQSSKGTGDYWAIDNRYREGVIEVGGNLIQKNGATHNFDCASNHKVVLAGDKVHRVEFESSESGFGALEAEGKIIWKGNMRVKEMLSDLTVEPEGNGELVLGQIGVNGKHLTLMSDVRLNGNVELEGGMISVNGSVLQTGGTLTVDCGIIEVSGDYRIQNTRNLSDGTVQYIGSDACLRMQEMDGLMIIGGDFVTQSSEYSGYYSGYNDYRAGTMKIGGDIIQKNGNTENFRCTGTHTVILTGQKGQKIEFESTDSYFNNLTITRPLSEYTFAPNPCWKNLEEAATSISDCTIKNITKKSYTGKAIKPAVTITYEGVKLVQDTDYTLSYANNKSTGKATVTITGIGVYTGTVEKSFNIVPAKVTDVKVTSTTVKKANLTWKKDATATGYVIEYSMDKTFKKNVSKITINKKATVSREITKLTSKKTYYFRIRAYKTIDGKKAYGTYSSVVSVQVK